MSTRFEDEILKAAEEYRVRKVEQERDARMQQAAFEVEKYRSVDGKTWRSAPTLAQEATKPVPLGVQELTARMDTRLHHREIMVTSDGICLVRMNGGWHTLRDDFSVVIELAPEYLNRAYGPVSPATGAEHPDTARPVATLTTNAGTFSWPQTQKEGLR